MGSCAHLILLLWGLGCEGLFRDLRERVITAVETGVSRREAAERFEVSVASAVKWLQRWYQQRSEKHGDTPVAIRALDENVIRYFV